RTRRGEPALHHGAKHAELEAHASRWTRMLSAPRRVHLPRCTRVGLRLLLEFLLTDVGRVPPRAEGARRHHLRARLEPQTAGRAEMVDVRVRHHDRVNVPQVEAREFEALDEDLPRLRTRHPRIDE